MADIATLQATDMLTAATNSNASDIFIIAGRPLTYKVNGFMHTKGERLMPDTTESLIRQIYILAQNRKIDPFLESGDDDFSFRDPGIVPLSSEHVQAAWFTRCCDPCHRI